MVGAIELWQRAGLPVLTLLLILYFSITNDRFLTGFNMFNIGRQLVTLTLVSIGVTYVIVAGGVDLSTGSIMSLVSVAGCLAMKATGSILAGVLVGYAAALTCGAINGIVVSKYRVQPFAATLAMLSIASGVALILCGGNPVGDLPAGIEWLGTGVLLGLPVQVYFAVTLSAVFYVILTRTAFGTQCYALGGNPKAAYLSGVDIPRLKIATFCISAFLSATASIIATSRVISGQPTLGQDVPLQAVAASVIGGASLSGGRGSVGGTLLGVVFMGVLSNGMNLAGVSIYAQDVLIGLIILTAAWVDAVRRRYSG
jgi:ribose/xylose/arabinose/galactoside ABC-type transport system permease subunit